MKISKKLLVMLSGIMLVGCTNTPATSGTTSDTTSGTTSEAPVEKTNMEKFKELFDALGTNYTSQDFYFYVLGGDPTYSASTLVVEPRAMLNMATRSGIALAKTGNKTQGYRYGIDVYASENESAMLTSYKPASYVYEGLMYKTAAYELNDANYATLFGLPDSSEINTYAKQLGYSTTFDTMFTEGVSEDGNVTFTTSNLAIAINFLDNNAFGRMEGYSSESYLYEIQDILINSRTESIKYDNIETVFTMVEDNDLKYLICDIYAKDSDIHAKGLPFMERVMIPMENLSEELKTESGLGLNGIVPSDFYENGPGAEPSEVAARRKDLVTKLQPMIESNNFTLSHTGGDVFKENVYTAKVYNDHAYSYEGEGFAYGYYYLEPTTGYTNASDAGIRMYSYDAKANPTEKEGLLSGMSLEYYKTVFESNGYTVDANYTATSPTETEPISVNERLLSVYQSNFNRMFYLSLDQFWDTYYGYSWEDLAFYNPATDSFLISDYYLKNALFGCDTITSNYCESVSLELFLSEAGKDPYATALLFDPNSQTGFIDFGTLSYSNIGTTKLFDKFATCINTKFGTTYPVDAVEETPVTPAA